MNAIVPATRNRKERRILRRVKAYRCFRWFIPCGLFALAGFMVGAQLVGFAAMGPAVVAGIAAVLYRLVEAPQEVTVRDPSGAGKEPPVFTSRARSDEVLGNYRWRHPDRSAEGIMVECLARRYQEGRHVLRYIVVRLGAGKAFPRDPMNPPRRPRLPEIVNGAGSGAARLCEYCAAAAHDWRLGTGRQSHH